APSTGEQGQVNLPLNIAGRNTHFVQGVTQVSFGTGVTVGAVQVLSPTHLTAPLSIAANAMLGNRTVNVTTQDESVSLSNALIVTVPATSPALTALAPNSGSQGQGGPITIVGANTHFVQGGTQVDFGLGIAVGTVTVSCPTC